MKRVSLDFDWPLHKVWKGYINPHRGPVECTLCGGSGLNAQTKAIADSFYDFANKGCAWNDKITQDEVQALVDKGRLKDFTHTWTLGEGWKPKKWQTKGFRCPTCDVSVPQLSFEHYSCVCTCTGTSTECVLMEGDDPRLHVPSAEEVNAKQYRGFIHDAINRWILVEVRAKRLGVYGKCLKCRGKGSKFPAHTPHRPFNSWREYEPPAGVGYQLWETCSEGSPISPVFPSAELLAIWCETGASIFADEKMSREQWFEMFTGKKDLDTGSLLVLLPGYFGALANAPA